MQRLLGEKAGKGSIGIAGRIGIADLEVST